MPPDILILGGGPAGLSTALHLANIEPGLSGRLLVLEKAHYPRHKLCGGGLTADAEAILRSLGLDVSEIPHVDAAEAHLDFLGRGLVIALRKAHALRIIRRDEFDAWLAAKARAAGIEIREGVTARRVAPHRDAVLVDTDAGTFEAAVVVGADGSNGIVRRSILPGAPIHTARALEVLVPAAAEGYSEGGDVVRAFPAATLIATKAQQSSSAHRPERGAAPSKGNGGHAHSVAYFDFAPVPNGIAGYTWDFPTQVDGQPMRCWGIYDTNLLAHRERPPLKEVLAEEMRRHGSDLDTVELQGHPIRWFSPFSSLSVPRVILVGDAAGADGIFGEGISIALGYGRIAAGALIDALARGDFSFKDYHRRLMRSPLGQALAVRTAIAHIVYRLHWAWFQSFFWRTFKPVVAAVSFVFVLNWAKRLQ